MSTSFLMQDWAILLWATISEATGLTGIGYFGF